MYSPTAISTQARPVIQGSRRPDNAMNLVGLASLWVSKRPEVEMNRRVLALLLTLAAVVAGYAVVALGGLPMKLNLIAAGVIGIAAGTVADLARERWTRR